MKRRLLLLFLLSVPAVGCSQQKADEPRQLVTVYPRYPEYAAANYIKGLVEVKFDIGADGTVTRIVFLRSEPHNLFRDEVVKAMAKWRFEKNRPCQGVKRQFIFTVTSLMLPVERGWTQEKNERASGYIFVMADEGWKKALYATQRLTVHFFFSGGTR